MTWAREDVAKAADLGAGFAHDDFLPDPIQHGDGCEGSVHWASHAFLQDDGWWWQPFLAECMACGARDCPNGEPLHYHHDGCPACCE